MKRTRIPVGLAMLLGLYGTARLAAATPRSWTISTAEQFSTGTLEGTAVDEDGRLRLGLARTTLWGPAEGIVWDVAAAGPRQAFVALSGPGRLLRVGPEEGRAETWFHARDEGLVTAVIGDGTGGAYFGLTPDGAVLHGTGADRHEEAARTGARFVWALALDSGGSLWIGTGQPGLLLRRESDGTLRTVFESGDDPVRCVAPLPGGGAVFGTGGLGRLIRVDRSGRAFVLLDADETEIVALDIGRDGAIFALAASGTRSVASAATALPAAASVIRVVATPPSDEPGAAEPPAGVEPPQPAGASPPPRLRSAVVGGALYRVDPDLGSRRLWHTATEVPFALVRGPEDRLLVATGDAGRIHALDERGRSSSLLRIASEQASALARTAEGAVLVGGTSDARVVLLGPDPERSGRYLGPVVDAAAVADWGRLGWEADVPRGASVRLYARAGNSAEPDDTWSEWVAVAGEGGQAAPRLPPTRWFQARADLERKANGPSPSLGRFELFYLPRNRAPAITALAVEPPGTVWVRSPMPTARTVGPVVASDPVARRAAGAQRTEVVSGPIRKGYELGARTVTWKAEDPDGDTLVYRLDIRREGTTLWLPLATEVEDEFYGWDARPLPDGVYRLRLLARDSRDNPEGKELGDDRVSSVFLVDNSRPSVGPPNVRTEGGRYHVEFTASDSGGTVAAVETALDGGDWMPVDPLDGVADSPVERYRLDVDGNPEGATAVRSILVRVTDSAGNLGGDAWVLGDR